LLQKSLLVLLVLSTGFSVFGVSAVVLAKVLEDETANELTTVSPAEVPQEVRIVVAPTEATVDDSSVEDVQAAEDPEEPKEVAEQKDRPSMTVSKSPEVAEVITQLEREKIKAKELVPVPAPTPTPKPKAQSTNVPTVPFYSQFADITAPNWQKVGCGITSLAMLIDYYSDETISVDDLLQKGIAAGAYISSAGWSHQGLINLSKEFGLSGLAVSLSGLSMTDAFNELKRALAEGPVMVSVHYTFEPTNPIPHLVVVNGVKDGKVFYNDPAEKAGGHSLSIEKFEGAWKKRYISIRPV
jgi:predicted double-glycine peptidase